MDANISGSVLQSHVASVLHLNARTHPVMFTDTKQKLSHTKEVYHELI